MARLEEILQRFFQQVETKVQEQVQNVVFNVKTTLKLSVTEDKLAEIFKNAKFSIDVKVKNTGIIAIRETVKEINKQLTIIASVFTRVNTIFSGFGVNEQKLIQSVSATKQVFSVMQMQIAETRDLFNSFLVNVERNVAQLSKSVTGAVIEVSQQAVDRVDSTTTRIGSDVNRFSEIWAARIGVLGVVLGGLLTTSGQSFLVKLMLVEDGMSAIKLISSSIAGNFDYLYKSVLSLNTVMTGFVSSTLSLGSFMGQVLAFSTSFAFWKFFFGESKTLVMRLLGFGQSSMRPLERASRLVTEIDSSLNSISLRVGMVVKTASFGIASVAGGMYGIFNPIYTIVPFLNSAIDTFMAWGTRSRLRFLAFFGSSRAQLQLFFLDAKDAFLKISPLLLTAVNAVAKTFKKFDFTKFFSWLAGNPLKNLQLGQIPAQLAKIVEYLKTILDEFLKILGVSKQLPKTLPIAAPVAKVAGHTASGVAPPVATKAAVSSTISVPTPAIQLAQKMLDAYRIEAAKVMAQAQVFAKTLAQSGGAMNSYSSVLISARARVYEYGKALADVASGKHVSNIARAYADAMKAIATVVGKGNKFNLFPTTFTPTDFEKFFPADKLQTWLKQVTADIATVTGKDFANKFANAVAQGIKGKSTLTAAQLQNLFSGFAPFAEKMRVMGENVSNQVAQGIEKNKATVGRAMGDAGQEVMDRLPSSPAKAGPLVGLQKSGQKIPYYVAQGILAGKSVITKAINEIAEVIAKHFPRSLPVLGPLVDLIRFGNKVPFYIAEGIRQGTQYVLDAANYIASVFAETLNQGVEAQLRALKFDIAPEFVSSFDVVLKKFGASAGDLEMTMSRLQMALNAGVDTEEFNKFKRLGIDLRQVREEVDPMTALMMQLADVLHTSSQSSEDFRLAAEALGTTMTSNTIVALRQGSVALRQYYQEAGDRGLFVSRQFANASLVITNTFEEIKLTVKSFLRDLVAPILPALNDIGQKVLTWLTEHRSKIMAVLTVVGESVAETMRLVASVIVSGSATTLPILKQVVASVLSLVTTAISTLTDYLKKAVFPVIAALAPLIGESIKLLFMTVDLYTKPYLRVTLLYVEKSILDALAETRNKVTDKLDFTKLIGSFADKLPGILKGIFGIVVALITDLAKYLEIAMVVLIGKAFAAISKYMEAHPKMAKALQKLGIDFGKEAANTRDLIAELESAPKSTTYAIEKLREAVSGASNDAVSQIASIDSQYEEAVANLGKPIKIDLSGVKREFEQLSFDKFDVSFDTSKITDKFKAVAEEIKATFKDLPEDVRLNLEKLTDTVTQAHYEATLKNIERNKELQKAALAENEKEQEQQDERKWQKRLENFQGFLSKNKELTTGLSDIFSDMYELLGKKNKEFFYMSKAAAMASATINIAEGITKAIAQGGFFGIAQGIMVAAAGAVQVAKIAASTITGYVAGGLVEKGSRIKDSVPAMLARGEYVIKNKAVDKYGPDFLDRLNNLQIPKPQVQPVFFNAGGLVSKSSVTPTTQQATAAPTQIVNIIDPSQFGKYMYSSAGRNIIFNVLSEDNQKLKKVLST